MNCQELFDVSREHVADSEEREKKLTDKLDEQKKECKDLKSKITALNERVAYLKTRTFKQRCVTFFRRLARPFRGRSQEVTV